MNALPLLAARLAVGCAIVSAPLVSWSCAGAAGAGVITDADFARARADAAPGSRWFVLECARCHGSHGEGLAGVPAILGAGALPEYPREIATAGAPGLRDPEQMEIDSQTQHTGLARRGPFRNGEDLYAFLKVHLRKPRTRSFAEADYAAVVGFLLTAQGQELPPGGLTVDNAQSIPIPRR
jgi:hypothetical protein